MFAIAINVDPKSPHRRRSSSVGDAFFQLKCYKKFTEIKKRKDDHLRGPWFVFSNKNTRDRQAGSQWRHYCRWRNRAWNGDTIKQILSTKKCLKLTNSGAEVTAVPKGTVQQTDSLSAIFVWTNRLSNTERTGGDYRTYGFGRKWQGGPADRKIRRAGIVKFKVRFNEEIKDPIFALTFKKYQRNGNYRNEHDMRESKGSQPNRRI